MEYQQKAEATSNLIGNKIDDKITKLNTNLKNCKWTW